jgi:hypothetical protein
LCAADPGLERPFGGLQLPVLERRCVLAEVPNVARVVLRKPVAGVLDDLALLAVSRKTRAVTPFAIFLVWSVTVTVIAETVPSSSIPR